MENLAVLECQNGLAEDMMIIMTKVAAGAAGAATAAAEEVPAAVAEATDHQKKTLCLEDIQENDGVHKCHCNRRWLIFTEDENSGRDSAVAE